MASKYYRDNGDSGVWWTKFRLPGSVKPIRLSLGTPDKEEANLLVRKLMLELQMRTPALANLTLPEPILDALGLENPTIRQPCSSAPTPKETKRVTILEALKIYHSYIKEENVEHWCEGKLSMLRQFFGSRAIKLATGVESVSEAKAWFKGVYVDELSPGLVQQFLDERMVLKVIKGNRTWQKAEKATKRRYREVLHNFFEVLLTHRVIEADNFHTPNPMSALPSYNSMNGKEIVYLTPAEVADQYKVLKTHPELLCAVKLMIEAGLRRSEVLWLRSDDIAADLSIISVVNREDKDGREKNELKTKGSKRSVVILPELRIFLAKYLEKHGGEWMVASPKGHRWDKDNFSSTLKAINREYNLSPTCHIYRHTYATNRADEGWTLWDLAKQMGNSVAVIEKHYAAFIKPSRLKI